MQGHKVYAKQWWMGLAGASMMALALPLVAAPPEAEPVATSVYLGQANAAASLEHWGEAAGFFEQAFATVTGEVSEEAFSWLVEAGDDWLKAGDRPHSANAYRHAAEVAGITGRLPAMAEVQNKLGDVLSQIDQREEAGKSYHRYETIRKLLKAGPPYPKGGPGWVKCEDLGYAMRLSRMNGDDTGPRLLLPDVPPNGGGQEYLIAPRDGRQTKVNQRGAVDWFKKVAQAGG